MPDGVNDRFDFAAPLPAVSDLAAVHMIAVGGSGMSGVARLLLARGVPLSGSDNNDVPVLASLRSAGARVAVGYAAANLDAVPDDAVVVVSSAIREDNPELAEVRRRGMAVLHRSQALAVLMGDREGLAVAGANGKTTTSGMAVAALRHAGADPSFAIGADIAGVGVNAAPGGGPAFVVEADESDGSFVVYRPEVAIVTNIRDDHLDFYGTSDRLHAAYAEFAGTIRPGGLLVACADDKGSAALAAARRAAGERVLTYGRSAAADLRVDQESGSGFDWGAVLTFPGGVTLPLTLKVPGAHNVLNAAGVALALTAGLGLSPERAVAGLASFRGTARRFEPRGETAGVRVVDDYAHNPGKLEAVVRTGLALREGGRLVVLFQPHLYSRTQHAADGLAHALRLADHAVVMDVYGAREAPVPGVSGRLVSDQVPGATFAADHDDAVDAVVEAVRPGDLVLTVGAGDVTGLGPRILERLAAGSATGP
ncbi:UDP-N-acetylmuramate--L-alanine ligase [Luteipulveratus sp. YIM 133132]|uniref:UDP-N-acetylmuramate--L-alanine ligase n=1 Tax=Luteipulveratus flavus TaxID=3031728 RepID=A0ABT6C5M5_9MICO|nr:MULTISPECIES: UDP-N-acetylmuramate--L-alanine ligase [unclassified Luteipulveratus]MDE9366482.1 UDP-N-acetylmuramate--L-alanine ligase [Luteipulveratus sp. YIM 133132]MDF8264244.1 UDP-N-acetylmuramate--L-alanine ligase [Luteipulveratus sp. YIM 133296]